MVERKVTPSNFEGETSTGKRANINDVAVYVEIENNEYLHIPNYRLSDTYVKLTREDKFKELKPQMENKVQDIVEEVLLEIVGELESEINESLVEKRARNRLQNESNLDISVNLIEIGEIKSGDDFSEEDLHSINEKEGEIQPLPSDTKYRRLWHFAKYGDIYLWSIAILIGLPLFAVIAFAGFQDWAIMFGVLGLMFAMGYYLIPGLAMLLRPSKAVKLEVSIYQLKAGRQNNPPQTKWESIKRGLVITPFSLLVLYIIYTAVENEMGFGELIEPLLGLF